jgi:hypothetical protein
MQRFKILSLVGLVVAATAVCAGRGRLEVSTAAARGGPCSAALADGRSLVTGGGDSPLGAAHYFTLKGSTIPAADMIEPRWDHICASLPDNTVLVAGGFGSTNRPTNSAELFHTDTGQWTITGSMLAPRTGATALPLADGRVLITGGKIDGQAADTLEIYDSVRGRFVPVAGILSTSRTGHAMAALEDGRVLLAGGTGPNGVLDTTDVFDPATGSVLPGPRMLAPRTNLTSTRLLDGKVLVAGGSDGSAELNSTEIFDPETNHFSAASRLRTARQGHVAVLIPGNGRVLVARGFASGQPLDDPEFFVSWRGIFQPAASDPTSLDGEIITVARVDGKGKVVSIGAYPSPTIAFAAGLNERAATVAVTGTGWGSGEDVRLDLPGRWEMKVISDAKGNISAAIPGDAACVFARGARGDAAAWRAPAAPHGSSKACSE